jgi:REP element-mobilizing transposase RayT
LINGDEKTVYHVMSRTALDGFPFGNVEKEEFVRILKRFSRVYFTEVLGFAVMGNHFHLLVAMIPDRHFTDEMIRDRYRLAYGEEAHFPAGRTGYYREKWSSLSEFVREIKQTFSRYYNRINRRRGTLWGERFKSVIVQNGETLVNCLAYIDLNAVRAGIVKRPEDYRWCSLGYHAQAGNGNHFLSMDFGMAEFGVLGEKERFRRYRRYVYEAGAIVAKGGTRKKGIDPGVLESERNGNFEMTRVHRFRYRTRYFTDSGIIGTQAFVSENYRRFRHLFQSRHEKKPKPIKGLDGIYSLKRLTA